MAHVYCSRQNGTPVNIEEELYEIYEWILAAEG